MADNRQPKTRGSNGAKTGLAAVGIAVLAVVCCAVLPLLAVVASSVALGTVVGVGASVVAFVGLTVLVVLRTRRRRACAPPASAPRPGGSR